ncbi:MAG: TerC/Alx family metal homeostasis membrane protein [Acidobacteriaceae bacterium]
MIGDAPLSYWVGFHLLLAVLLAIDIFSAPRDKPIPMRSAVLWTCAWVLVAVGFGIFIHHNMGRSSALEFITGYAVEESLSIDNLFVFLVLFHMFEISGESQHRVLFWGVIGAIVMRALFISGGIALLDRFNWVNYLFAAILLAAAVRLVLPHRESASKHPRWLVWLQTWMPVSSHPHGGHFFHREKKKWIPTTLLLTLIAVEVTDLIFALDSIPAVLAITRHPFLAYTSNIFAVLGLRSLYFTLAGLLERFYLLHYGLAVILAFVAVKMLLSHVLEISALASLSVIFTVIALTIAASLTIPRPTNATKTSV